MVKRTVTVPERKHSVPVEITVGGERHAYSAAVTVPAYDLEIEVGDTPPPPPPPPEPGGMTFGVYRGGWPPPDEFRRFEDRYQIRVDHLCMTFPRDNRDNVSGRGGWFRSTVLARAKELRRAFPGRRLEATVATVWGPGPNWALMVQASNGSLIHDWRAFLEQLVGETGDNWLFRPNHEATGGWFEHGWSMYTSGAADRARIHAREVGLWAELCRTIAPGALIDINLTMDGCDRLADLVHLSLPEPRLYDVLSVNRYNQAYGGDAASGQSRTARENRASDRLLAYCQKVGKPAGIGEFGVGVNPKDPAWGGDEPRFMYALAEHLSTRTARYGPVRIFDVNGAADHRLDVTCRRAEDAFREVFPPLFMRGPDDPRELAALPSRAEAEADPLVHLAREADSPEPNVGARAEYDAAIGAISALHPDRSRPPELQAMGDLADFAEISS